jgi:PhnB protein
MKLPTYLGFDGDCRQAMAFYAEQLGGTVTATQSFGEAGCAGPLPTDMHERIMHGCMETDGFTLMGTDATPEHPYRGIQGAHVVIDSEDPAQAERLFVAFAHQGYRHAPATDLLVTLFWHGPRPLRRAVDDHLQLTTHRA